jgi:hypothetical protein
MKLCHHHRDLNVMRQRRFAEARSLENGKSKGLYVT